MNTLIKKYFQTERPLIGMAPMPGYSDIPFRTICEQMGADFSVTTLDIAGKPRAKLEFTPNTPNILQLIGSDIQKMAEAAGYYGSKDADIIDINLGRPAKGDSIGGSALLNDLNTVQTLLAAVVKACPVPVTLKTRLGINPDYYTVMDVAKIACDLGIELMTVHGRTQAEGFSSKAQFAAIADIKAQYPQLAILANGDITSPDRAKQVITATACDGVMVGRGAIGEPWLFSALRATLDSHFAVPTVDCPVVLINHIKYIHAYYGDKKGSVIAKRHIGYYLMKLGLGQQMLLFTDEDSPGEQIAKISRLFAREDVANAASDNCTDSSLSLSQSTGPRSKAQIKDELFILYDRYHDIHSKYSGEKLSHRLNETLQAIAVRKAELREQSWLGKLKRLCRHKKEKSD
ncbi:MAG: hypothetical protein CR975_07500 [Gammaproteobacteria bacterium]|nr:MAG: hypothetical protein CR975_07500 [Gammaproteobacteria bacterium]